MFNCGISTFRRICQEELGINRWPAEKIQSVRNYLQYCKAAESMELRQYVPYLQ
jgi:hypothetical protein